MDDAHQQGATKTSPAAPLCKALKEFAFENVYTHPSVLEVELQGHETIEKLMDVFWTAIQSDKESPFHRYVYGRISEGFRRVADADWDKMPQRYRELQLLTDMISGMTDGYAIDLLAEFEQRGFLERPEFGHGSSASTPRTEAS